jgi:amino acid transporter
LVNRSLRKADPTLARRTLGKVSLAVFAVGASSPLTVLIGGIPTMYGAGVVGVPLCYLVVGLLLLVVAVGYVAMARHIHHPAPFYAHLAHGLGPTPAISGAAVALLGYNAIQISLYGLIGTRLASIFATGPWWVWAAAAWIVVAMLGRFRGAENARVLGGLLVVELAVILLFDLTSFTHPAPGPDVGLSPFAPSSLFVPGAGGVIAFAMASLAGAETPPVFGEEARGPRTVAVSTFGAIAVLGALYAVTAWAFLVQAGSNNLVTAAQGTSGPFSLINRIWGVDLTVVADLLLVTSVLTALSAFHATVARYVFSMARERVLPARLAAVTAGARGGTPLGGSFTQSAVAALTISIFAVTGADPMSTMFVWLSTIGAVCILLLLTVTSLAAVVWFHRGGGTHESAVVRQVLPGAGVMVGGTTLLVTLTHLSALLGAPPGSLLPWLVVVVVLLAVVAGLVWARILRFRSGDAFVAVGRHIPDTVMTRDPRLADIQL